MVAQELMKIVVEGCKLPWKLSSPTSLSYYFSVFITKILTNPTRSPTPKFGFLSSSQVTLVNLDNLGP